MSGRRSWTVRVDNLPWHMVGCLLGDVFWRYALTGDVVRSGVTAGFMYLAVQFSSLETDQHLTVETAIRTAV